MKRQKLENIPFRVVLFIFEFYVVDTTSDNEDRYVYPIAEYYGSFKKDPTRSIFLLFTSYVVRYNCGSHVIPLSRIKYLTFKDKEWAPYMDVTTREFKQMKNIKTLHNVMFNHIRRYHVFDSKNTLETLACAIDYNISSINFLNQFTKLKELELNDYGPYRKMSGDLKLPNLKFLHLRGGSFSSVVTFKHLPNLERVYLDGYNGDRKVSTECMRSLGKLKLKHIKTSCAEFENNNDIKLLNFEHLEYLRLYAITDELRTWLRTYEKDICKKGFEFRYTGTGDANYEFRSKTILVSK